MAQRSRTRLWTILAAAALLAAATAASPWGRRAVRSQIAQHRHPTVVLVTLDTLNVWHTGPYNPGIDFTPTLDRFAARGLVFDAAHTTVPLTLPSHAAMLSGKSPAESGVMLNGDTVEETLRTLPEVLGEHGYRTAAFVSLGVLQASFGLDRGFELYVDDYEGARNRAYRTADEVLASAVSWLEDVEDEPAFLWVHLSDPHSPYVVADAPPDTRLTLDGQPLGSWNLTSNERHVVDLRLTPGRHRLEWTSLRTPRPDDGPTTAIHVELIAPDSLAPYAVGPEIDLTAPQPLAPAWSLDLETGEAATVRVPFTGEINNPPPSEMRQQYDLEVAFVDRHLDMLAEAIGRRRHPERTLWAIVSDHGEGLYDWNLVGHARYSREDQLRLLWILAGPGIPRSERIDAPVMHYDVGPTLLDLLGLPALPETEGRSQAGCWQAAGCFDHGEWWAYGAVEREERVAAVAGYRWPLKMLWIDHRGQRLYDLAEDRREKRALPRRQLTGDAADLDRRLPRQRNRLQQLLEQRATRELTDEQAEQLRALGYL